jgi:hypothetical protein
LAYVDGPDWQASFFGERAGGFRSYVDGPDWHMWTAPIGKPLFSENELAAFGHMSGLSVRT